MAKSYKVFQGSDGQFYFNVYGSNGEVLATSEGYTRKHDAVRGFKALRMAVFQDTEITEENSHRSPKPTKVQGSLTFDPGCA